jgi:hypothetical protein
MNLSDYLTAFYFIALVSYFIFYIYWKLVFRKKQKQLNVLYRKLYEEIKDKKIIKSLCTEIRQFAFGNEYLIIDIHFRSEKPSKNKNKEFYNHESYTGNLWWWKTNFDSDAMLRKSTEQRKLFILKMIEITN